MGPGTEGGGAVGDDAQPQVSHGDDGLRADGGVQGQGLEPGPGVSLGLDPDRGRDLGPGGCIRRDGPGRGAPAGIPGRGGRGRRRRTQQRGGGHPREQPRPQHFPHPPPHADSLYNGLPIQPCSGRDSPDGWNGRSPRHRRVLTPVPRQPVPVSPVPVSRASRPSSTMRRP
ncbi:hypothetical protein GCM10020221_35340 [Streptomyces thioluteus]|uniref:Uncharacterized protein n=1 Tax=Streptomyces thioluteus TaxID=66431 RepID=A0ABN3X5M6_STRTU